LKEVRDNQKEGLQVLFWRISREWNQEADWAAKNVAGNEENVEKFKKILGVDV